MMFVREATQSDLPELMRLAFDFHKAARLKRHALFEESRESWERWLRTCIASPDALSLVADEGDDTLGAFCCAICFPAYWNPTVKVANELTLWVSPETRGKGVASEMINRLSVWAKQKGASLVAVGSTVYLEPKAMKKLMLKHGFSLEERVYSKRV